jgi:hypothetical protein
MHMKNIRVFAAAKLLLAVLATAALISGSAVAQTIVKGTFQLDEQVQWNGAVLAPGSYTIVIDTAQMPLRALVRSVDQKTAAYISSGISDGLKSQQSFLVVTGLGANRRIRSLNLPQLGKSLVYDPMTKGEREELARQQELQTIAVYSAGQQ